MHWLEQATFLKPTLKVFVCSGRLRSRMEGTNLPEGRTNTAFQGFSALTLYINDLRVTRRYLYLNCQINMTYH